MKKFLFLTILGFHLVIQTYSPDELDLEHAYDQFIQAYDQFDEPTKNFARIYCGPFDPIGLDKEKIDFIFNPDPYVSLHPFDTEISRDPKCYTNEESQDSGYLFEEKRIIKDSTDWPDNPLSNFCDSIASCNDESLLDLLIKERYPKINTNACQRFKALISSWKDNPEKQRQDCLVIDENGNTCFLTQRWISNCNINILGRDILPKTKDFLDFLDSNKTIALTKNALFAVKIDENGQNKMAGVHETEFYPYVAGLMMIFKDYDFLDINNRNLDLTIKEIIEEDLHISNKDKQQHAASILKRTFNDFLVTDKDGKQFAVYVAPYCFGTTRPHPKVWAKWENLAQMDQE